MSEATTKSKLLWFVGIWLASVAALSVVAYLLRLAIL